MTIGSVLRDKGSKVETIAADASVLDSVHRLGEKRIGALLVTEGGRIAGIMSERDVIYCLRNHGPDVLQSPVSQVMTAPAITAETSMTVLSALALMTQRRIRHLPIVEDGDLKGIVSIGDLVKHRMERIEAEAEAMLTYIQSAGAAPKKLFANQMLGGLEGLLARPILVPARGASGLLRAAETGHCNKIAKSR